jgi:hypothetical protein
MASSSIVELRRDILAAHVRDPSDAAKYDGKMLCLLYDDAEVVLTKGGALFGCRGEHMIHPGMPGKLVGLDLPLRANDFSYAILDSAEHATSLRARIEETFRVGGGGRSGPHPLAKV